MGNRRLVSEKIRNIIYSERNAGIEFCRRFTGKSPFLALSIIREDDGRPFFEQNLLEMKKKKRIKKCYRIQVSYDGIGQDQGTKSLINPLLAEIGLEWTDKDLRPRILETIKQVGGSLGSIGYGIKYFLLPFIIIPFGAFIIRDREKWAPIKNAVVFYLSTISSVAVIVAMVIFFLMFFLMRKKTGGLFRLRRLIDYYMSGREIFYPEVKKIFCKGIKATYKNFLHPRKCLVFEIEGMERLATWQAREIEEFFKEIQESVLRLAVVVYWDRRKANEKEVKDIPFSRSPLEVENISDENEWTHLVGIIANIPRWKKVQKFISVNETPPLKWLWLRTFGNPELIEDSIEKFVEHSLEDYHSDWDKKIGLRKKFLEFKFQREWARLKSNAWIDNVERLGMIEKKFRAKHRSFTLQQFTNPEWALYRNLFDFESSRDATEFLRELKKELVLEDIEDIRFSSANLNYLFDKDTRMGEATKKEQAQKIAKCFQKIGSGEFKEIATEFYFEEGLYKEAIESRIEEIETKRSENYSQGELVKLLDDVEDWIRHVDVESERKRLFAQAQDTRTTLEQFGVFKGLLIYLFNHKRVWDSEKLQDNFRKAFEKFPEDYVEFQKSLVESYLARNNGDIDTAYQKVKDAKELFDRITFESEQEKIENRVALLLTQGYVEIKHSLNYQTPINTLRRAKKELEKLDKHRPDLVALIQNFYGYALAKSCDAADSADIREKIDRAEAEMQRGLAMIEGRDFPIENDIRNYMARFSRKFLKSERLQEQISWFRGARHYPAADIKGVLLLTEGTAAEQEGKLEEAAELYRESIVVFEGNHDTGKACRARIQLLMLLDVDNRIDNAIAKSYESIEFAGENREGDWGEVFSLFLSWMFYRRSKTLSGSSDAWYIADQTQRQLWRKINRDFRDAMHIEESDDATSPLWWIHAGEKLEKVTHALLDLSRRALPIEANSEPRLPKVCPKALRPLFPFMCRLHLADYHLARGISETLEKTDRANDIYYHALFLLNMTRFYALCAASERAKEFAQRARETIERHFPHLRILYNDCLRKLKHTSEHHGLDVLPIFDTFDSPTENAKLDAADTVTPIVRRRVGEMLKSLRERRKKNPDFDPDLFPFHMLSYFDKTYECDLGTSESERRNILSFLRNTSRKLKSDIYPEVAAETQARMFRMALDKCNIENASHIVRHAKEQEPYLKEHLLFQAVIAIADFYRRFDPVDIAGHSRTLVSLPISPIFADFLLSHIARIAAMTDREAEISLPKTFAVPHTLHALSTGKSVFWQKLLSRWGKGRSTEMGKAFRLLCDARTLENRAEYSKASQACSRAVEIFEKFDCSFYSLEALMLLCKIRLQLWGIQDKEDDLNDIFRRIDEILGSEQLPVFVVRYCLLRADMHMRNGRVDEAMRELDRACKPAARCPQLRLKILEERMWVEYFDGNREIESSRALAASAWESKLSPVHAERKAIATALAKRDTAKASSLAWKGLSSRQGPIWTAMACAPLLEARKISLRKCVNAFVAKGEISFEKFIAAIMMGEACSRAENKKGFQRAFRRHQEVFSDYALQHRFAFLEERMEKITVFSK